MNRTIRIITLFLALMGGTSTFACEMPRDLARLRLGLLAEINHIRKSEGLSPVAASDALAKASQDHACDMADKRYFAHQAPDGPDLGQRVKQRGYRFRLILENIAMTPGAQVGDATEIWMASAPHRRNILDPKITEIGFGIAKQGRRTVWVMDAGNPR